MSTTTPRRRDDGSPRGMVAWGVASFAGIMLAIVATFQILEGIAAIADDDVYVTGLDYVYELDVTTWGWIHLVVGVLGLVTGVGILGGATWGRLVGIMLAGLGALTSFTFLPYFPLWSLVILAFNGFVIWALCVQIGAGDAG